VALGAYAFENARTKRSVPAAVAKSPIRHVEHESFASA